MRKIKDQLYRIKYTISGNVEFVECTTELELMMYLANYITETPVSVVKIESDGRTPKVPVYTNQDYKRFKKQRKY